MLEKIAPNLFIQRHPLRMLGCQMGRVVTLIRLASGKVLIHSTGPFTQAHIDEIRQLGQPEWMIDATCFHDTFAKEGRAAFPDAAYLVPPGFKGADALHASPLSTTPEAWSDEIQVIAIEGMPKINEFAFFHRPSKTLIVADLIFNLPPEVGRWTQMFLRATGGIREFPGMSRLFRFFIKDRQAFLASMREIEQLDFERIVVAHGDPITDQAKAKFLNLLGKHGLAPEIA